MSSMYFAFDASRQPATAWLLACFTTLTAALLLLLLLALRFVAALLCDGSGSPSGAAQSASLFLDQRAAELIDVDLSRTPPELEQQPDEAAHAKTIEEAAIEALRRADAIGAVPNPRGRSSPPPRTCADWRDSKIA